MSIGRVRRKSEHQEPGYCMYKMLQWCHHQIPLPYTLNTLMETSMFGNFMSISGIVRGALRFGR